MEANIMERGKKVKYATILFPCVWPLIRVINDKTTGLVKKAPVLDMQFSSTDSDFFHKAFGSFRKVL